jgi:major type 1 subunit fimbrin (pilin)
MKNIRLSTFIATAALAALPLASHASDGTITFKGAITSQTCTISGGGQGNNFSVTLPTLSTSSLTADGATAGSTPFTITLTNCTPNSGNVSTYFETGATVDIKSGQLANAQGTATNVEVRLLNSDQSQIVLGQAQANQNSHSGTISAGSATLNYSAEYAATGGAATAGSVLTDVTYSMSYN